MLWDALTSMWDICLWWSVCTAILLCAIFRLRRRSRATSLATDQRGAAYSLNLVMIAPFYTLLIAVIVECTLMMIVKIGVTYAAYSAARSAIVWMPAEVDRARQEKMVHLAAAQALTPFASSSPLHVAGAGRAGYVGGPEDQAYYRAYRAYANGDAPADYLSRKRQYALAATQVLTQVTPARRFGDPMERDVTVTVRYHMPFHVPGVGRIFGSLPPWSGARFYTRTIESTATLQLENPVSRRRTLGIRYDSWNL